MRVTVTISDELAVRAQAQGLTPATYVEKLLAERSEAVHEPNRLAARVADLERFFEEVAAHSDKIPPLPESAFLRENFYQE